MKSTWEEQFEFDIAHRQGKCLYPLLALCSAEEQRIKSFIRQLLQKHDKEIDKLIVEEILICHKEGIPTSRLTSLSVKLQSLKNKR